MKEGLETPSVEPPPVTKGKDWKNQLIGPWVLCWNTEPIGR